jgi:hypothetical protein
MTAGPSPRRRFRICASPPERSSAAASLHRTALRSTSRPHQARQTPPRRAGPPQIRSAPLRCSSRGVLLARRTLGLRSSRPRSSRASRPLGGHTLAGGRSSLQGGSGLAQRAAKPATLGRSFKSRHEASGFGREKGCRSGGPRRGPRPDPEYHNGETQDLRQTLLDLSH